MSPSRPALAAWLRCGSAFALLALVLGGIHAVRTIGGRTWVLEFQAGLPSPWSEKLAAIVQATAIEGFGFLALGLALGGIALGLMRFLPHLRGDEEGGGFGAGLVLALGGFFGFVELAWIAEDALDFLTRPAVIALDLAGVLGVLVGLVVYDQLVRRCPWTPRAALPSALGSLLAAALATSIALRILMSGEEGWRNPTLMATAGVVYLLAVPAGGLVARLLARPSTWLVARVRQGPLVPRAVAWAGWAALAGAGLWTAFHWELSPLGKTPSYATLPARPGPGGPNVVFVTVDTLRADHLSCYGYPRPTSPFLDSLAAEGTRVADAISAASWTKPATGTILTGLHPSRHGALYHGSLLHLPEGKQTLAEGFQERGYVTGGFVANPNLKRVFAFDRGFDTYFDSPVEDTVTLACIRGSAFGAILMTLLRHQFNWNYENDIRAMNREVLAWVEKNHRQPFFLYAHYIDPHIPYDPPAVYREQFAQDHGMALFNDRKRRVGIDLYDGEIRYTDDGLKELVTRLQQLGAWENTLFVLTSDHGEEFFEHGYIGHGFSLYQEVVHVPLILRGPGVPAGLVHEEPVQIVDLAATVLALAGRERVDFGDGASFHRRLGVRRGQDALGDPLFMESEFGQDDTNHRAFVFTGARLGPWKLVLTEENQFFPPDRHGREALYHLGEDPGEKKNLFHESEYQPLIQGLLERLRAHAQFLASQGFRDVPPAALTPEIEAGLRALGYIGAE
ncbi:MAG TPA: sulfatase [Planctomycetota bacterium]